MRRWTGSEASGFSSTTPATPGWTASPPYAPSSKPTQPSGIGTSGSISIGVMNCTRAALPSMISRNGGRIITVVSDAARYGDAFLAPYAAAKAGAAGFCRSIAREVGRYNITVNCVALAPYGPRPRRGPTPTRRANVEREQQQLKKYIIRRKGEPEDAAGLVGFLAGPSASWITGQTYPVNGGYSFEPVRDPTVSRYARHDGMVLLAAPGRLTTTTATCGGHRNSDHQISSQPGCDRWHRRHRVFQGLRGQRVLAGGPSGEGCGGRRRARSRKTSTDWRHSGPMTRWHRIFWLLRWASRASVGMWTSSWVEASRCRYSDKRRWP